MGTRTLSGLVAKRAELAGGPVTTKEIAHHLMSSRGLGTIDDVLMAVMRRVPSAPTTGRQGKRKAWQLARSV
jgi:hypothetical protein